MMHIGIFGCGQLARMLGHAGWRMGMSFSFVKKMHESDDCVRGLGRVINQDKYRKVDSLYRAMGSPDVITVEKEGVDTVLLRELQKYCPVFPEPEIIHICQHRGREKSFLQANGIPVADWAAVHSHAELVQAVSDIGYPLLVKSCEHGYDGQNQWHINTSDKLEEFMLAQVPVSDCVVERKLDFDREISILIARSSNGDIKIYPVTQNRHVNGILLTSIAPAEGVTSDLYEQIDHIVAKVCSAVNYVGVLAIECFVVDGRLLVNEMAPRVHNSGHWTMQGSVTDQFENHLRVITGQLPGNIELKGYSAMLNLLGRLPPADYLLPTNASLHLYNKSLRSGRKMGHINFIHEDSAIVQEQLAQAVREFYPEQSVIIPPVGITDSADKQVGSYAT